MTFISTMFGTWKIVRRTAELDGIYIMITDMIFAVTMVLWKVLSVSYLSMRINQECANK